VTCKSCGAAAQAIFSTEIAIHVRNVDNPLVFIFPNILVCLNCGMPEFAEEFTIPESELRLLLKRNAAGAE